MSSPPVTAGAVAFVGPSQVPALECFSYLLVVKVQGASVLVRVTGPDATDSSPEFDVKTSVLRHRIVDEAETELWPGSYVGHPIAFVQPSGDSIDQWAYGLVTGYNMDSGVASLHIRTESDSRQLRLTGPSTVIAVDRLNYALRTGATVNVMVLNALELVDRQNEVIVACGKSRSGLPASVTTTMLSVPFTPDERVPLIRPDTLEVVHVRRQHIVDCELNVRGNNPSEVFKDPVVADVPDPKARTNPKARLTNDVDLTFSDSDDEGKTESAPTEQADIELVRLDNRPLRKRARITEPTRQDLLLPDDIDVPVLETRPDAHKSAFRPSEVEQYVHNAIAHPSLIGKKAQAVLESSQQGPRTKFLGTPPVLRLSYDLSFGIRGLSLMHFRRFFQELERQSAVDSVNMTNFGRSNALHPATPPKNIDEIVDAFKTLLYFAEGFYNTTVCNFIKTGADFMEQYALFTRPDAATCSMLVFWINSKLGKFRSQLITSDLATASLIGREFTRNDDHLMELYQARHDRQMASLVSGKTSRAPASNNSSQQRQGRSQKVSAVPHDLLALLPKQGNKSMCMRYLSKKGCTGPAPGQCFDPNRAHFKPLALPADAKQFIDKNFLGLAAEFQDL